MSNRFRKCQFNFRKIKSQLISEEHEIRYEISVESKNTLERRYPMVVPVNIEKKKISQRTVVRCALFLRALLDDNKSHISEEF